MCGFVGFFNNKTNVTYNRSEVLYAMNKSIEHRGPDSDGEFIDENISLGFRRLSIIDLKGGDQPQVSVDGRYVIVFNGEIYNYRELRDMLIDKYNVKFKTKSDTETILHIYETFKEKTAEMLRGMFSFVIYDKNNKSLYGARDCFGIKPFYYYESENDFLFGSEIKSFLPHPSFKKEINKDALKMYLVFQYVPTQETIFKNVYKFPPGHYFIYKNGKMTTHKFFNFVFNDIKQSKKQAVDLIDDVVKESISLHNVADVEVGSFLSGGVDSSFVASVAKPDKTYSVGFKIDGYDETSLAHDLCDILEINNKQVNVTADEFFDSLSDIQYYSDEPHANLSAVPLYFLSKFTAKDLKVVLSGEGADELFAGYDTYIEGLGSSVYNKLPIKIRKKIYGKLRNVKNSRIHRFFKSNSMSVEEVFIGQAYIMNDDFADKITKKKYRSMLQKKDIVMPLYKHVNNCDDLTKKLYLDMNLWLPYDILLKADKMTMANSLEVRVPFLDKEVWNVARTLSKKHRVVGRHTKIVFREAALRHIPKEWSKRKKAGFMVPFRVWIKEEKYANKVREYFNKDYAKDFFDTEILLSMLDKHVKGLENNARIIYTVYSFLLWYEQFFVLR